MKVSGPGRTGLALAMMAALIAGCSSDGTNADGNIVEMRDMDVIDGTINDAMTNLDAARADGLGTVNSAENTSETEAKPAGGNAATTQ